jgi:hypothetical protein
VIEKVNAKVRYKFYYKAMPTAEYCSEKQWLIFYLLVVKQCVVAIEGNY